MDAHICIFESKMCSWSYFADTERDKKPGREKDEASHAGYLLLKCDLYMSTKSKLSTQNSCTHTGKKSSPQYCRRDTLLHTEIHAQK